MNCTTRPQSGNNYKIRYSKPVLRAPCQRDTTSQLNLSNNTVVFIGNGLAWNMACHVYQRRYSRLPEQVQDFLCNRLKNRISNVGHRHFARSQTSKNPFRTIPTLRGEAVGLVHHHIGTATALNHLGNHPQQDSRATCHLIAVVVSAIIRMYVVIQNPI